MRLKEKSNGTGTWCTALDAGHTAANYNFADSFLALTKVWPKWQFTSAICSPFCDQPDTRLDLYVLQHTDNDITRWSHWPFSSRAINVFDPAANKSFNVRKALSPWSPETLACSARDHSKTSSRAEPGSGAGVC